MAIRDLLWACPACGAEGTLQKRGRAERCTACGVTVRRGAGSTVVLQEPGRAARTVEAPVLAAALPPVEPFGAGEGDRATAADTATARTMGTAGAGRRTRVVARAATEDVPVRGPRDLLGFREVYGPKRPGELILEPARVRFRPDAGSERAWPLERVTAIQASSSSIQIKARGEPVVSFRFPEDSPRFWEELLQEALRRFYRERGMGEIREFQPRIETA